MPQLPGTMRRRVPHARSYCHGKHAQEDTAVSRAGRGRVLTVVDALAKSHAVADYTIDGKDMQSIDWTQLGESVLIFMGFFPFCLLDNLTL